jgi:uncharacterized membrane protein YgcG
MMRNILIVVVLALMPSTAGAQEDPGRWLPWIGCWQSPAERLAGDDARVCIVPAEGGVKMLTVVGDQISTDQTVVADGLSRAVVEGPCTGDRRVDWSSNGHLLFTRAEIACAPGPSQKLSGLHLFTSGPTWIDIQLVEAAGRENVRARRYERLSVPESIGAQLPPALVARAADAALRLSQQPLTVEDIIEANGNVPPTIIETALFETKSRFALSSRSLIALHDAGVEEPVIDLMLAISYPERFAVNRWVSAQPFAVNLFPDDSAWLDWSFSRPYWAHRPYSGFYSAYGSIWYNSGWDLRYFPRGDSYAPAVSFGVTGAPATASQGSVVKGQGYTRGRPPVSTSNESSNAAGTAANTRERSVVRAPRSSSNSDASSSGSSGGSGSSSASSGGYSSGSSGGGDSGGGRTAVDRD